MLPLLLGKVAVGHFLPVFGFHDLVSVSNQRAEGRSIDGLAAVDTRLDVEEEGLGSLQFSFPILDELQLRVDDHLEIHAALREVSFAIWARLSPVRLSARIC